MYDVVALGELLIDFTTQSIDSDGYPTMAAHPGGAPANFLAAIAKFGGKVGMLGKVGTDTFGKLLTNTLRGAGIETKGLVAADDVFTTLAFVTLDENGDREFAFARKPVEYAKAHGKLVTYDPNLRKPLWNDLNEAKEQMLWGLRQADVVKISDEEVEFLFGLGVQDGAQYILDHYPVKLVFVTCGADGCWFQNRSANGHVDSLKDIKVVDTTGAGDIFGGSAVWKLLQTGKRPEDLDEAELTQIVSFACRAAGLSTTKHGGISSVPDSIS